MKKSSVPALIRRIITLAVLVALVLLAFKWCNREKNSREARIDNTPLKVEMIRNIAEIATVSYKDEVVADSVEYYKNQQEQIAGNLMKIVTAEDIKHGIRSSNIKRRLTLLVKGEIRYGFNLTAHPVKINETDSVIYISLPPPSIVDIQITPSSTEVFQETGQWKDYEIKQLHYKARRKLISNAASLKLEEKSMESMHKILTQLVRKNKQIVIKTEK